MRLELRLMNKIKEVLMDQGRSQKWFAEKMGKTENTISLWVLNKVQPSLNDLYKAAEFLGVSVHELLTDIKKNN